MEDANRELNMLISAMVAGDGDRQACVYFSEGEKYAEGYVPGCVITSQKGFSDEELEKLKEYLAANSADIICKAKGINPIKAMISD